MKIKELMNIQIFLGFTGCTHSNFLPFLFRDIHLVGTDVYRYNVHILKAWIKFRIKRIQIFIILNSDKNWVTQMSKILISLDSCNQ